MNPKIRRIGLISFAAGLVVGIGLVLLRTRRKSADPQKLLKPDRISRTLDRCLARARQQAVFTLAPEHRYVIFSDHHKGAGDRADDFRNCRQTYLKALNEYNQRGFTLILLGDVEELLENPIRSVMQTYPDVFESEKGYYPDRYIRLVGNHDIAWAVVANLRKYLNHDFPDIKCYESLVFRYQAEPKDSGEIFLAHGHQGTLDADVFRFIPPLVLPIYRQIQNLTGWGSTSPSRDDCLRGAHDTILYRWSTRQGKLILIAGHTHRPVWSSRTHLQKLVEEYNHLRQQNAELHLAENAQQMTQLESKIQKLEAKYPPCNDTIKTRPSYFNTGCCRYADGDITGIELEDGELRLVKWGEVQGEIQRVEFERTPLAHIFANLE